MRCVFVVAELRMKNGSNGKRWEQNVLHFVAMLIEHNVLFMRRDNKSNNVRFAWFNRTQLFWQKNDQTEKHTNQLDWLADGEFALYRLEHYFFIFIFYKSKIFRVISQSSSSSSKT